MFLIWRKCNKDWYAIPNPIRLCIEAHEATHFLSAWELSGYMLDVLEETLRSRRDELPQQIALLRLDTDWYET